MLYILISMSEKYIMSEYCWLPAIRIRGYRPFRDLLFTFKMLEVIVGANGSGKTSLFEFLKFLRDACNTDIPPEIIADSAGQRIFHSPGPDKLFWNVEINLKKKISLYYQGEIMCPIGTPKVSFERVVTKKSSADDAQNIYTYLDFRDSKGLVRDPDDGDFLRKEWKLGRDNRLGLGAITDANLSTLYSIREYIRGWRFYNPFNFNLEKIRRPVAITQSPILDEDAGNLGVVLFYLMTEYPEAFADLKSLIQFAVPGFKSMTVKARGGLNEVLVFWEEDNVETELTLADLGAGTLRFIAWASLCVLPDPPSLICIDDPSIGLHPRTLAILAGLFEKAAEKTQVLLTTHSSYFLTQFDLDNIAILKKVNGQSVYINAKNSKNLMENLKKIGIERLEHLHRTDELEALT